MEYQIDNPYLNLMSGLDTNALLQHKVPMQFCFLKQKINSSTSSSSKLKTEVAYVSLCTKVHLTEHEVNSRLWVTKAKSQCH